MEVYRLYHKSNYFTESQDCPCMQVFTLLETESKVDEELQAAKWYEAKAKEGCLAAQFIILLFKRLRGREKA